MKHIRAQLKAVGDLGTVAMESKGQVKSIGNFFSKKEVKKQTTLIQVFNTFTKISQISGGESVKQKTGLMIKLIQGSTPVETKYIVRWLQKNLKIGAAESTVVSALARAFANTPGEDNYPPEVISYRKKLGTRFEEKEQELDAVIKEAICEFPNYTLMIESLLDLKTESAEKLKE